MDIVNLNAAVPVRSNEITMKVLLLKHASQSKIFRVYNPFDPVEQDDSPDKTVRAPSKI